MKPARPPEHAYTRIHFWNPAGAQSLVCPAREARHITRHLISAGAVVWYTEVHNA